MSPARTAVPPAKPIPVENSARTLAERYDLWLCDIWGVVHNGRAAHVPACEALDRYRDRGGVVVLITNAPRPRDSVADQLDRLGVPRRAYDLIVSSGDVTRALLSGHAGERMFHLGPDRDAGVFAGLGLEPGPLEGCEVVLCTGLFDDTTETPDTYRPMLSELAARAVPMICANPDLMVERGHQLVYCAGALAEAYAAMGAPVSYAGKPHRPIYEVAMTEATHASGRAFRPGRVLAIGDGLKTDMAGAAGFGVDAAFIPSGVHVEAGRQLDAALIEELFAPYPFRPVCALPRLQW